MGEKKQLHWAAIAAQEVKLTEKLLSAQIKAAEAAEEVLASQRDLDQERQRTRLAQHDVDTIRETVNQQRINCMKDLEAARPLEEMARMAAEVDTGSDETNMENQRLYE